MSIADNLARINWDFSKRFTGLTRSPHWYPGTFPSEVPATLIETLTGVGDLVMDPYSGIGTTSFEALRLGRSTIAVDVNPVAYRISSIMAHILKWRSNGCAESIKVHDMVVGGAKLVMTPRPKGRGFSGQQAP